jgi:hypothetical protein
MVEDLIKRLNRYVESLAPPMSKRYIGEAIDLLEQQAARITSLESERDALLAAAGKEAVAWQVRRADGRIDGVPIQWENCTQELYDATLATGRYAGYENGPQCEVRALYTAPTAAPEKGDGRDAWISVDDRMPDEDSVVLVSAWEYGKPDGKRFTLVARRSGSLFLNEETGDDLYTPTHWQPLPAPPAALSQKAGEQQ